MGSWIDLVGSFIVGAFIILIVANINMVIASSSSQILFSNIVQADISNTLDIVEHDFYKVGYRVSGEKISKAQKKEVKFALDIDDNGSDESLHYYLGEKSELSSTVNPSDRLLYRVLNDETPKSISRVSDFILTYHDSSGTKLSYSSLQNSSTRKKIKSITIYVKVESAEHVDSLYQGAEWKRKISPKNLN